MTQSVLLIQYKNHFKSYCVVTNLKRLVITLSIRKTIIKRIESRVASYVGSFRNDLPKEDMVYVIQKKELCRKRNSEILKCRAEGQILGKNKFDNQIHITYLVHYQFLINQNEKLYLEEYCEERRAIFESNELIKDSEVIKKEEFDFEPLERESDTRESRVFKYNRLEAVRYAERWWNSYNSNYKKFDVDCTNFISQCLHAGGAPMTGQPNRSKGWWMANNNWSYSWSVAHSFRWYLSGSKSGLQAKEVSSPSDLLLGDVICYDFQGDGRFDHTTIVVAKDQDNMPLVNAHTTNSRLRYWNYEDSTAYTPNIKYKFFTIVDHD